MIPSGFLGHDAEFTLESPDLLAGVDIILSPVMVGAEPSARSEEMSAEFKWYFSPPEDSGEDCRYYNAATCPECGQGMIRLGGCLHCPGCGFSSCGL